MRVDDQRTKVSPDITLGEIPLYTVFQGWFFDTTNNQRYAGTFLRAVGCVVQLDGENDSWGFATKPAHRTLRVYQYQPVHGRIVIERNHAQ